MTLGLTQPGILSKAQRNQSLFSYVDALQREAETGPELSNEIIPDSDKRNCIVLYGAPDPKDFPKLWENKKKTISNDNRSTLSTEIITTWKDELQSSIVATEKKLQQKMEHQSKEIDLNVNETLHNTLKDFQKTFLSEEGKWSLFKSKYKSQNKHISLITT